MSKGHRRNRSFERAGPIREPYEFVLIVCEGTKSEPNYFKEMRSLYRLSNTNVKILPADGTDPLSIVAFANQRLVREGYDKVFCVFDRDGHINYSDAMRELATNPKLKTINSVPCFEVWILLHFLFTAAPFNAVGSDSACDCVIKVLRAHLPNYKKGASSLFSDLEPKLATAIANSKNLERHNKATGTENPFTGIHVLVEFLKNLKAP
jgi:RloB-like protein